MPHQASRWATMQTVIMALQLLAACGLIFLMMADGWSRYIAPAPIVFAAMQVAEREARPGGALHLELTFQKTRSDCEFGQVTTTAVNLATGATTEIERRPSVGLKPGVHKAVQRVVTLPAGLAPGFYYLVRQVAYLCPEGPREARVMSPNFEVVPQ